MIVTVKCDIKTLFLSSESGERAYGDFLSRQYWQWNAQDNSFINISTKSGHPVGPNYAQHLLVYWERWETDVLFFLRNEEIHTGR